jgi:hypothetical protein
VYKQIDDLPYSVSNTGEVRNNKTGRLLKYSKFGYYYIGDDRISKRQLMKDYFKFEFIKDLQDDEECKPIIDYDGYYITNKGRIFSMKSYSWLKPRYKPNTYYYEVNLYNDKPHVWLVHQIVGKHFLEGWCKSLDVCHTDENLPENLINCVDNLWLGTRKQNIDDAIAKGRVPQLVKM